MVEKGDCTGPKSAEFVLKDPTVEFAVLETARGGIIRAGLGFSKCDIAIVTNIAADHLGLKDIHTLEDLAKVKSVLPESVKPEGYAILNADDDLVYAMRENLECNVALFSMDENNPRIIEHCNHGGYAAIVENGFITILKGNWKIRISKVVNIPLTFGGKAIFMIQNILPACLATYLSDFKIEDIRASIESFIPSPAQTPGRLNVFQFNKFTVLIDYAHNPAGLSALGKFLERIEDTPKVGIITGVGDRRDEDIRTLGEISATIFDKIIIRQDRHLRGRKDHEIIDLLQQGILSKRPDADVKVIINEVEAIEYAIKNAVPGSYIVVCSDVVAQAVDAVLRLREEEAQFALTNADIPNTAPSGWA
jgi:cyanophycin synthetase